VDETHLEEKERERERERNLEKEVWTAGYKGLEEDGNGSTEAPLQRNFPYSVTYAPNCKGYFSCYWPTSDRWQAELKLMPYP